MVTTHLGDLRRMRSRTNVPENRGRRVQHRTLRPTYRLHIGQFGMSNALKIARRLKLPRDCSKGRIAT